MPANHETMYRQWQMLRNIPRYPQKITANELWQRLDRSGLNVHKRSVERDLKDLSRIFPLVLDSRSKPYGWSWHQDAQSFDLPALGNSEALMLLLAEKHLMGLMPSSTADALTPYFKAAHQQLSTLPKAQHFRSWSNKVRAISATQPLISPKTDPDVQRIVSEGLLHEKQIAITYQPRGKSKVHYRIHPLALVQRGPITYLSVRINDYPDVRTIALHRILSAELVAESVRFPEKFNIDEEIDAGRFGFGQGEQIRLKAVFKNGYGDHLYETPLSKDQAIEARSDGTLLVTALVADTLQLEWWLLGLGEGVEVLAPKKLRTRIAHVLRNAVAQYANIHLKSSSD